MSPSKLETTAVSCVMAISVATTFAHSLANNFVAANPIPLAAL